jgi:hypothetical protein
LRGEPDAAFSLVAQCMGFRVMGLDDNFHFVAPVWLKGACMVRRKTIPKKQLVYDLYS